MVQLGVSNQHIKPLLEKTSICAVGFFWLKTSVTLNISPMWQLPPGPIMSAVFSFSPENKERIMWTFSFLWKIQTHGTVQVLVTLQKWFGKHRSNIFSRISCICFLVERFVFVLSSTSKPVCLHYGGRSIQQALKVSLWKHSTLTSGY